MHPISVFKTLLHLVVVPCSQSVALDPGFSSLAWPLVLRAFLGNVSSFLILPVIPIISLGPL